MLKLSRDLKQLLGLGALTTYSAMISAGMLLKSCFTAKSTALAVASPVGAYF